MQNKSLMVALTGVAMLFSINISQASNGYMPVGSGAQSKGMAGAGIAHNSTVLGGVNNPALLVHIGNQYEIAVSVMYPPRGFTAYPHTPAGPYPVVTPGDYKSDGNFFPSPAFAYNRMLDDISSIGFSITGSGMATEYNQPIFDYFHQPGDSDFFIATAPAGVELMQFSFGVPYSLRFNEKHSIGITLMLNVQAFEARGGEPFRKFSIHPGYVTNNGRSRSTGLGIRVGWLGRLTDQLSLGASYQPRSDMSKFAEYKGLFAEEGDFDIPQIVQLGLSYRLTPALSLVADFQYIGYGDIKSLANPNNEPITNNPPTYFLGNTTGIGGGWQDAEIFKLGMEWQYNDKLALRAGYSESSSIIPETQMLINIVAPVVNDQHFTMGASYHLDSESQLNFSLLHAPKVTTTGYNPNTGGEAGQQGSIYMEQTEITLSYTGSF